VMRSSSGSTTSADERPRGEGGCSRCDSKRERRGGGEEARHRPFKQRVGGGGRGAGGGRWPHGGAAVKFDLKSNSNHFKTDSNHSKFECSKKNFPELKKIEKI
jgi:hypothetical protein